MELLTVEHKDFTMIVECTKFDGIWNKAKGNVGEDKLYSTYSWSEGVVSVKRTMDADHETDIEQGVSACHILRQHGLSHLDRIQRLCE